MLSICREFLPNGRQRVVVVGAPCSECFKMVSGIQGKCVRSSSVREMFDLVSNRLYTYADDYTLLAVFRNLADGPAVAVSLTGTWL